MHREGSSCMLVAHWAYVMKGESSVRASSDRFWCVVTETLVA